MLRKMIYAQYRRPAGLFGRWIGQRMARQHIPENEWTVQLLDVQPSDHILEIGFGPGLAIERLSHQIRDGWIAGIDYSRAMVYAARRRNAIAVKAGRVDLHNGDVHHLPFDDAVFDRVFSIHSIYFWLDPMRALGEIYRVMKVGGMLAITLLPADQPETGTPEFKPYTGQEIEILLSKIGFVQPHSVADKSKTSPSNFAIVATR